MGTAGRTRVQAGCNVTYKEFQQQNGEARKRLGLTGLYPYPVIWFLAGTDFEVRALTPEEAAGKFLSISLEEQIKRNLGFRLGAA